MYWDVRLAYNQDIFILMALLIFTSFSWLVLSLARYSAWLAEGYLLLSFGSVWWIFFLNTIQTNFQLLASCYLQNNQAYSAYHILKGMLVAVFYVPTSFGLAFLFLLVLMSPLLFCFLDFLSMDYFSPFLLLSHSCASYYIYLAILFAFIAWRNTNGSIPVLVCNIMLSDGSS